MAQATTTSTTLTNRYVSALLDAAQERGRLLDLATGARDLIRMIDGSEDLRFALGSPLFAVKDVLRAVTAVMTAAGCDPVLQSFVGVVIRNRRGASLVTFLRAALAELSRREGLVEADIAVATPLNDIQQKKLADMLGKWAGARVHLNIKISPEVLGGIKIRMGSIQIDDSISGKLARLRQTLLGTVANA